MEKVERRRGRGCGGWGVGGGGGQAGIASIIEVTQNDPAEM